MNAALLGTPGLPIINRAQMLAVIESYLQNKSLNILEAGCGRKWPFDKGDHTITGVDMDDAAMNMRIATRKDLDRTIVGDLRTVDLPKASYDLIYCSYVLEHLDGAEEVLDRFVTWLKPGGLLILRFPNRDSVYGFFTRITPLWVHVLFKRYGQGNKSAGKPGYDPYPTFHNKVVSRRGLLAFAGSRNLMVREEYGFMNVRPAIRLFIIVVGALTLGKLASDHINLLYVLQK